MTASASSGWLSSPFLRFLLAGGTNTVATGALVALLSLVLPAAAAFTIAFVLGLVYAVVVNGFWVFRSHLSRSRVTAFVAAYCGIYLVGLFVVQLLDVFGWPPALSGASVLVTAPLSFIAGRQIFSQQARTAGTPA